MWFKWLWGKQWLPLIVKTTPRKFLKQVDIHLGNSKASDDFIFRLKCLEGFVIPLSILNPYFNRANINYGYSGSCFSWWAPRLTFQCTQSTSCVWISSRYFFGVFGEITSVPRPCLMIIPSWGWCVAAFLPWLCAVMLFSPQVTWSWPMTGSPSTSTRWWWTRSTCPRRSWPWCSRSPLFCQPGTPWGLWPSEARGLCLPRAIRSSCNREFQWSEAIAKQWDRAPGLGPIPEM